MACIIMDQYGDPHLGHLQYGSVSRCDDFMDSFSRAVDSSIKAGVKLVCIPGDLFHHSAVNPDVFTRAKEIFARGQAAGIRFLALDGNHDAAKTGWRHSWVGTLARDGLLFLLRSGFEGGHLSMVEPDGVSGSWFDPAPDVRIYGCQYLGGRTNQAIRDFSDNVETDPGKLNILCQHAGVEGMAPGVAGGISKSLLPDLSGKVDILVLGHIHMPYTVDGWVFSAGSLEPGNSLEAAWSDKLGGGINRLTADKVRGKTKVKAQGITVRKRKFFSVDLDASSCLDAESVVELVDGGIEGVVRDSVIDLSVSGTVMFPREEIDMRAIEAAVAERTEPLVFSRVANRTLPIDMPALYDGMTDRNEMERAIVSTLAAGSIRHVGKPEVYAEKILEAMDQAINDGDVLSPVMDMLKEQENV